MIRTATAEDAPDLVRLINLAYRVEDFFMAGDRIEPAGVLERMARPGGSFLVIDGGRPGRPLATVFLEPRGTQGYFGLLAVDPAAQGAGLARKLITEAEAHFQRLGFREMMIDVVTLRTELFPFYAALGYEARHTIPLDGRVALRIPAELRIMVKPLRG
jgi:GNAT superfamily N-acetyltransferase